MELRKLKKLLLEIQDCQIVARQRLDEWELKVAKFEDLGRYAYRGEARTVSPGQTWGGLGEDFDTGFFRKTIEVPTGFEGYGVELQIVTGGEAQLFIDDQPFQGNDPNHFRVLLTGKAAGGERYNVSVESWIRIAMNALGDSYRDAASSGTFSQADLVAFDPEARQFLRDVEYAIALGETHADLAGRIEAVLSEIFTSFDITDRHGFFGRLAANSARLALTIGAIPRPPEEITVWMLGQSHLDIAWFWRTAETYRKSIRTFSSVLRYMELYPFYRFMMPQVKLYRMAGEACPALLERVRGRLREGRWEISGMMYLESDTNLPRGEWLVRNLLLGLDVCRGLGQIPRVESLIDAFGYSGNLPQIFAKSGIDSVMLTKMMWYNDTNKFPYSAFNWRGVDGTSVLVATMPWFNRPCGPAEVAANVERLKQKDMLRDVPVFFGWGDGGGGADENHLEMLARDLKWNRPARVVAGRLDEFFEKLSEVRDRLPTWWGEVYQEGHRGCYTTQARHKKLNRASETLYRSLEWLMGLEQWQGGQSRQGVLAQNVERIVTNQFHDTLSGSAANRVYADSAREYETILGEGSAWQSETLGQLAGRIDTRGPGQPVVLWNLHGFSRPALVEMDWSDSVNGTLTDGAGKEVPCQVRDGKLQFVAKDLPQFGYSVYRFTGGKSSVSEAANPAAPAVERVENDCLLIEWNSDGQLTRMFSKLLRREFLRPGGLGNKLVLYFDYPFSCDAWDLDSDYRRHPQVLKALSVTVHPREAICQRVTFEYATDRSTIRQTMVLYEGMDRVEFVTQADWHERHRLLKAHFDTDVQAPFATYDIPFGAIQRDTRLNDTWQQAKFEVPGISFADLSEPGAGVAIVSPHKSGFMVRESDMSISLLRSSTFPDEQADQGRHEFSYSVLPHEGDFARGGVVQESRLLLNPVVAQAAEPHSGDLPACKSFLQIDRPNVVVETLKAAEDGNGLVLRVYEAQGQREMAAIAFSLPVREVLECNLMEASAAAAPFADGRLTFDIRPFEIKSYRLTV